MSDVILIDLLKAYTYPERNRDGTEFTFTAPVTTIKVDSKVNIPMSYKCVFFCVVSTY